MNTITFTGRLVSKPHTTKRFFFLEKGKFLGHISSPDGISPMVKRVEDLKNLKPTESKLEFMKALECCYEKSRMIPEMLQ